MGKFEDLTGKRFGRLTVHKRIDDYVTSGGKKKTQYLCVCDCGKEVPIQAEKLKSGHTQSCGCLSKEMSLARIEQVNDSGMNIRDLTGQRFGRLTCLYILPSDKSFKNHSRRWHCKCDCGNEIDVFGQSLVQGLTKSCGCFNNEVKRQFEDLTGQRFGHWIVLERVDNIIKPSGGLDLAYLCKCDCGTERIVLAQSLKNGNSLSCGCVHQSKGELYLSDILDELHIKYVAQLKFEDLRSPNGVKLSFDFGLYYDDVLVGLVEYQGQQHYVAVDFFGGEETYNRQIIYDDMKRLYALEHNIPLLEIPYNCSNRDDIKVYVLGFWNIILKNL